MTTQAYQIVMRQGPNPGKVFELTGTEAVIGRDISNQITVNDAEVSRRHTRLEFQGGGYIVEDLGSTNGTFVNGRRLTGPHSLRPGETIRLGETVSFTYELLGGGGDATVAAVRQQAAAPPPAAAPPQAPAQRPAPSGYAGQVPAGPPAAVRRSGGMNSRTIALGCGVLAILGACIVVAALWYIDANFLWCDVFGGLIPGC